MNDVNINDLSSPDIISYSNIALLNRIKMNALFDGSSSAIVRIDMVENGYSATNEGMYYQQLSISLWVLIWHAIRMRNVGKWVHHCQ